MIINFSSVVTKSKRKSCDCHDRFFFCSCCFTYSLKLNELIQSSQTRVYFFFKLTPAKNTSVQVKQSFYISSSLSCRYTIDTRVLQRFSSEWQHGQIVCLYISHRFSSWCEAMAKCLVNSAAVPLLGIGNRVQLSCSSGHYGHRCQAHKPIVCLINLN